MAGRARGRAERRRRGGRAADGLDAPARAPGRHPRPRRRSPAGWSPPRRREAWRVRAAGRKQLPADQEWFADAARPGPGSEEQVIIDDQRRALWAAIGQLSRGARNCCGSSPSCRAPTTRRWPPPSACRVGSIGPTRGRCLAKLRALLADEPGGEAAMTPPDADAAVGRRAAGRLRLRAPRRYPRAVRAPSTRCPRIFPSGSGSPSRCATWRSRWPGSPRRTSWPSAARGHGAEPHDHLRQRQPDHHDPDRREPGRHGARRRLAGAAAAPRDRDEDHRGSAERRPATSRGASPSPGCPRGTAQLIVRPAEPGPRATGPSVVTPALIF